MSYNRFGKIYNGPGGSGSGGSGGGSGLEVTIDITGLLVIDMATYLNYTYINLTSSNANETINRVININNTRYYEFRPANGLTISWNDLSVAPPVPTPNLRLAAPTIDTIGTGKGYLGLRARVAGSNLFQTEYLDQYS